MLLSAAWGGDVPPGPLLLRLLLGASLVCHRALWPGGQGAAAGAAGVFRFSFVDV